MWSADLCDKPSLSKHKNYRKFILRKIDKFTKYAWAVLFMVKSGVPITKGFKLDLLEDRKPEIIWFDRGSERDNSSIILN